MDVGRDPGADAPDPDGFGAGWVVRDDAGEVVARLTVDGDAPGVLEVGIDVIPLGVVDRGQAVALLDAIVAFAIQWSRLVVRIRSNHDLVRYSARGRGFAGGLRAPLSCDLRNGYPVPPLATGVGAEAAPGADVIRAVRELLPDRRMTVSRPLRISRVLDIVVTDDAWGRPMTIRVPDRADAMPEPIAALLDTSASICARYPIGVHRIACEMATWGMTRGRHGGVANPGVAAISLHPLFVVAGERERQLHRAASRSSRSPKRKRLGTPSAGVPEPYLAADGTMAHELWHVIESASSGPDAVGGVEFHRLLGEALGVETLEQALRGGEPGAPADWRAAHQRVREEVSPYATLNPREAKAEMFKLWWCRGARPPAPIVAYFGNLLEGLSPPAAIGPPSSSPSP